MAVKRIARKISSSNGDGARADRLRAQADTPVRLIKDLNKGRVDPAQLTNAQRKAVLVMTANGKQTSAELGILLGCKASRIRQLLGEIRREVGREVGSWSVEEVLGSMAMTAEKCSAMAMEQEDPQLAWSIERDKVKILQQLGVVAPQDPQDGVRITMELLGRNYERATSILGRRLDPRLTGRVVPEPGDVQATVLGSGPARVQDGPEQDEGAGLEPPEQDGPGLADSPAAAHGLVPEHEQDGPEQGEQERLDQDA